MTVTQDMTDAAGEAVLYATTQIDMIGIAFLQTAKSGYAIYHLGFKTALKRRFTTIAEAREFAIERFMDPTRRRSR